MTIIESHYRGTRFRTSVGGDALRHIFRLEGRGHVLIEVIEPKPERWLSPADLGPVEKGTAYA